MSRLVSSILVLSVLAFIGMPAGAQAPQTGIVKIGVNEVLSGDFVAAGVAPAAGVRLAVKEINESGGFVVGGTSYQLQLIEYDNRSQGAAAIAGMIKLTGDDKVKFVFGPTVGALANQTLEITVPAKVIHFNPATAWQATVLRDPKSPLTFGTQVAAASVGQLDAEGFKALGAKKIAFISPDDDTTKGNITPFMDAMKTAGIEVVTILYPPKTADFSSFVTRAKAENAEAIYFLHPAASAPDLLRTVVELKAAPKGFGGRALPPSVALTAIGRPLPMPFFSTLQTPSFDYPSNPKMKAYTERMRAFAPNVSGATASFSFFTYDFVFMLVEAMKKAGTVEDTTKIAQALGDITYNGVAGKICFGKEVRHAVMDGSQIFVRDGKVEVKTFPSSCK